MVPCHPGIGPGTRSEKYLVLYDRERPYSIQIIHLYSLYRAGSGESIVSTVGLSKDMLYVFNYQRHPVGQTVKNSDTVIQYSGYYYMNYANDTISGE